MGCLLIADPCVMYDVCCLFDGVHRRWLVAVVCWLLRVVRCLLWVVCRLLFVACWLMVVDCCLRFVV